MKNKLEKKRTLTPQQAEDIYGLPVGTLANYRCQKRGPQYFKCGRRVYYRADHLEEWLLRNPVLIIDSIKQTKERNGKYL